MLRELGFTYRQMEAEEGCVMPVVEISCRYRSPARYDDALVLETRLIAMRGSVLKFAYRLLRPEPADLDSTLLAEAVTTHIVVDRTLGKRALPEAYATAMRALLNPAAGSRAGEELPAITMAE